MSPWVTGSNPSNMGCYSSARLLVSCLLVLASVLRKGRRIHQHRWDPDRPVPVVLQMGRVMVHRKNSPPPKWYYSSSIVHWHGLQTFKPPPLAPSLPQSCNAIRGPVAAHHENYRTCCSPYPYTSPDAHPTRYCSTGRCVRLPHLATFKPPPLAPSLPRWCNAIRGPVAARHENYRTCCRPYPYTSPDAHPTRYCSTSRCVGLPHWATFKPPPLAPSLP